jgi:hypothetical protein
VLLTALNNNGHSTLLPHPTEEPAVLNGPLDTRQKIDVLVTNAVASVCRRRHEVVAVTMRHPDPYAPPARMLTITVSGDSADAAVEERKEDEVQEEIEDGVQGKIEDETQGSQEDTHLAEDAEPGFLRRLAKFQFGLRRKTLLSSNTHGPDEAHFPKKGPSRKLGPYAIILPKGKSSWKEIQSSNDVFSVL